MAAFSGLADRHWAQLARPVPESLWGRWALSTAIKPLNQTERGCHSGTLALDRRWNLGGVRGMEGSP